MMLGLDLGFFTSLRQRKGILYVILFIILAVILNNLLNEVEHNNVICELDSLSQRLYCRPKCKIGTFSLRDMKECRSWLICKDLERDIVIKDLIVESTVKKVYLAEWEGHEVVVSELRNNAFQDDFSHNLQMLRTFSPSPFLVQLLGFCNDSVVITEYSQLGSAINVQDILETKLPRYNTITVRLNFCISYVLILEFFHNGSPGVRVMCDSSTLSKTLSQYLITDDLRLVANDVDALPEIDPDSGGITCGHRELQGDFVAPEQSWPFADKEFDGSLMPLYNEKSDVWKVPDVCDWFLGTSKEADIVRFCLFSIHQRCKDVLPQLRPTASDILEEYMKILKDLDQ